jgi:hypothetical protein
MLVIQEELLLRLSKKKAKMKLQLKLRLLVEIRSLVNLMKLRELMRMEAELTVLEIRMANLLDH